MINNNKIFAAVLITILTLPTISSSFGENPDITIQEIEFLPSDIDHNKISNESNNPKIHHTLQLFENINVNSNDEKSSNTELNRNNLLKNQKTIFLYENISVYTNESKEKSILLVKKNSDTKAIMERILDYEKKKQNHKFSLTNISIGDLLDKTIGDDNQLTEYPQENLYNILTELNVPETFQVVDYQFLFQYVSDQFDPKNQNLLLILAPLAFFVIVRSENEKISFPHIKPILSYGLVFLLILSTVVTPLSISSAYWSNVYAEEFSQSNEQLDTKTKDKSIKIKQKEKPVEAVSQNQKSEDPSTTENNKSTQSSGANTVD